MEWKYIEPNPQGTLFIPLGGSMVGILSLLCVCLYGYGFLRGEKRWRETSHFGELWLRGGWDT